MPSDLMKGVYSVCSTTTGGWELRESGEGGVSGLEKADITIEGG